jgi:hypothetical protein
MTFAVHKNAFSPIKGELVANASDIGFPPGQWPTSFAMVDESGINAALMQLGKVHKNKDGDVEFVEYRMAAPWILGPRMPPVVVFND